MFYYLLARNVNISKNIEQVASITVIKYIILVLFGKLIEYKYLEPGFLTPFFITLIVFDVLFSAMYHYKISSSESNILWEDEHCSDINTEDYEEYANIIHNQFGKRTTHRTNIEKPINLNNSNINLSDKNNKSDSDGFNTEDLEGAINRIISDPKNDIALSSDETIKSDNIEAPQVNILSNFSDNNTNIID